MFDKKLLKASQMCARTYCVDPWSVDMVCLGHASLWHDLPDSGLETSPDSMKSSHTEWHVFCHLIMRSTKEICVQGYRHSPSIHLNHGCMHCHSRWRSGSSTFRVWFFPRHPCHIFAMAWLLCMSIARLGWMHVGRGRRNVIDGCVRACVVYTVTQL
jgi:hypothetical protein